MMTLVRSTFLVRASRNVSNVDRVKKELEMFCNQEVFNNEGLPGNVEDWVMSVVRNYLIRDYPGVELVLKALPGDPAWLAKALKLNQEVHRVVTSHSFWTDLEHALGYLKSLPNRDLSRISFLDAVRLGNELIENETSRSSVDEDLSGVETLYTFPDGYFVVRVNSKQALEREGKLMHHCVGSARQHYIRNVRAGNLEVWSLRDPDNEPHATLEYSIPDKRVRQVMGKNNKGVASKHQPYLEEFLDHIFTLT